MAFKKKTLKYAGFGLLALLLLFLLLLPALAKNYIVENSKSLLGRQVEIAKLRLNYFTGTVRVFDFKMLEANDKDIFISFDTLVVNTAPLKYFSNVKALDELYLQGLRVTVAKRDSTYNFDDLVAFHTGPDSSETVQEPDESFKYLLENIGLKNASFRFYDADVDHTTEIADLSLFIPSVAWNQEHDSNADIAFTLGETARVTATANVHPGTGNFQSSIAIENLQLQAFYKYLREYAEVGSLAGSANAVINLTGNMNSPMETLVSGEATAFQPRITDLQNVLFLAADTVFCRLGEIDYSRSSYRIDELVFEKPYLKFELDSVSNNLFRIFRYDPDAVDSTALEASEEPPLFYALNRVKVSNGLMDYTDNLTGNPFHYALSAIAIDTDSIRSDSKWVSVASTMLLNERGKLKAEVGYNPADPMYATIDIGIEDFRLSDLNIYSSYYTGHSILTGNMFYFCDTEITGGRLRSDNHLLIKDVAVENIKGGLFAIPLKLAIWLLKDRNGDIELDIPVRGNLDDPTVDTWALIGTTLKKRLFDATDNPVKPLARFIGAEPEDLESIALHYPDTALTAAQIGQLDLILELERQKAGLGVEMNLVGIDSLSTQIAQTQLAGNPSNTPLQPEGATIGIDGPARAASEPAGLTVPVSAATDSLALAYANTIIYKVTAYLKAQKPDTGVVVQMAKVSDKNNIDADPRFFVYYTLREEGADSGGASETTPGDRK